MFENSCVLNNNAERIILGRENMTKIAIIKKNGKNLSKRPFFQQKIKKKTNYSREFGTEGFFFEIDFTPLVSRLWSQVGCVKKQYSLQEI